MEVITIVTILLTVAGPPAIMVRRRRWPVSAVVTWGAAVAVMVYWMGTSAVYADTLPGGSNPEPFGVRPWFVAFVVLGVAATVHAWLATRRLA